MAGRQGCGRLAKRLITEPDLFIEAKGRDGVTVPNMLHVVMASNEHWAVPAGEDERRFAVFEVSDCRKQSEAWFQALYVEMEGGGLAAMLHELLAFDLGDWHPRRIPKTGALLKQQARGLSPEDEFWVELLESGSLPACDPDNPDTCVSGDYVTKAESFSGSRETKHHGLLWFAREFSPRLKGKSAALFRTLFEITGGRADARSAGARLEVPSSESGAGRLGDTVPGMAVAEPRIRGVAVRCLVVRPARDTRDTKRHAAST